MATILVTPTTAVEDFGDLSPLVEALSIAGDGNVSNKAFAESSGQIPAAPSGSMADLVAALKSAEGGPAASTDDKKAPPATAVCIVPKMTEDEKRLDLLDTLFAANSVVSLYTAIWAAAKREKRGHPEPYDITIASEAAQAFADQASCAYTVMSEGLAGYFNYVSGTSNTMNRRMTKTTLHLEFIAEVFKGFNLGDDAKKVLDGVLTKFVESVADFSVSTERTNNTVDHSLRICQFAEYKFGDGKDAEKLFVPRIKIVYMQMKNSTYSWATKKAEHNESNFAMDYRVVDFDLNVSKFKASRPKLETIFAKLSGKSLAEFSQKVLGKPVVENSF